MTGTLSLVGQVALVTGASSGIGLAAAVGLAKAGARVVVNHLAQEAEAAQAVVGRIAADGGQALALPGDISQEADVRTLFAEVIARCGTLHILVNNAGIQRDASLTEMTLAQWNGVLDVNLTGQFLCAREAAKEFLRRGVDPAISRAAGKIISMSSVHQSIPWAGHANYATSKGGVRMLTETMAQELAPSRIRVNAIAPGAIRTPINTAAWETDEALRALERLIPYGRIGEPEDVARAVVWLASDESDYVTGTTLVVDGGMMLYPGFRTGG